MRTVFRELARVPSPQTDLLDAEPLLDEFMKIALLPRMKQPEGRGGASVRWAA